MNGNKLYRLTFSKSLAELISNDTGYHIQRFNAVTGRILTHNEQSSTHVYGVVSKNNGVLLRAPLNQHIAEMYRNSQYRDICEVYLEKV